MSFKVLPVLLLAGVLSRCSSSSIDYQAEYPNFYAAFGSQIDLGNLPNYANQSVPNYINKDNTENNPITDQGALLGRILFYDVNLSSNNTVSCASCHQQAHAFSDTADVSTGVNGVTGRHSMRLVNSRFAEEEKFFWDERANTLEDQVTEPIQDHNEMGFSGSGGAPDLSDLIVKLSAIGYYQDLFRFVYGDSEITENRIQLALAQFVRSIQSFDSKYDVGRAAAGNDNANFSNFTANENAGKSLFMAPPNMGGAGCRGCHEPPEFDIEDDSGNNGVIGVFGSASQDQTVTRSPSLRDLVDSSGNLNGALMHDASMSSLEDVINHYNNGVVVNAGLDNRLAPGGVAQNLGLNATQISQLVDFLKTLSGSDMYSNEKWSDPFN